MCFGKRKKQAQSPPEETVTKNRYDNVVLAHDVLLADNGRLTQEVAHLQQQVAVLVINEDVMRRLTVRAIGLLERVSTTHRASPNFKREIDALVAEARSAGVIEK